MNYVELHKHTCFSVYDGSATPRQAAAYAKKLGHPALAITDHGNMNGVVEHYLACKELGVHPVIGVEGYLQPRFVPGNTRYHVTLLAQSIQGYQNLAKMLSESAQDYYYRDPIFTFEQLQRLNAGIIMLSGCVAGFIPQQLLAGKVDRAETAARKFKELFGDRFYLEVQPFSVMEEGRDIQKLVNEGLLALGEKLALPVVMTADVHYVEPESYPTYAFMWELADQGRGKKMMADYRPLHMHQAKEVGKAWLALMGTDPRPYMAESLKIAERCQVDLRFQDMIPKFEWGMSSTKKLALIAKEGLSKQGKWTPAYKERMYTEFDVIKTLGFEDYFLMVWDILEFARSRHIHCEARGSVCGSLLAYALGITSVDPVLLGTYFERFLRKDKHLWPDIDVDIEADRRDEVVEYVLQKYQGCAAPISNYGVFSLKNLINDIAKKYNISDAQRDELKLKLAAIGYEKSPMTVEQLLEHPQLGSWAKRFEQEYPLFLTHFTRLFGQVRYIGRHAAGIAITSDELGKYTPLIRTKSGIQTAFDMNSIEKINVLKLDLLGVDMASVRAEVERTTKAAFTYAMLDDPAIYADFAEGLTDGVFQFNSRGARSLLKKVKPANFQELTACNAMNRPGPLESGLIDLYIAGKNGDVDTSAPWYEITKETYGTFVYQEQAMYLCVLLAKMDWDSADKFVKGISKKKISPELQRMFTEGLQKHAGLTKAQVTELFRYISLYSFNKNHSVGYTIVAVHGMHLRQHHPIEYYTALLRHENTDVKRKELEASAVYRGEQVLLLAHVNGRARYSITTLDGEKVIQAGLASIPNVGITSALEIEARGPYESVDDLVAKVPKRYINSKVMTALKSAGALEFHQDTFLGRSIRYCSSLHALGSRLS